MSYDVHLRQVERSTVVTERKHTTPARLGEEMHRALAETASAVEPTGSLARLGYKPVGPPREVYLVGPSACVKPASYRTEIEVPVA